MLLPWELLRRASSPSATGGNAGFPGRMRCRAGLRPLPASAFAGLRRDMEAGYLGAHETVLRKQESATAMNREEKAAYQEALRRIEACRAKGDAGIDLDLSSLALTALPPEIGRLATLKRLGLGNNLLATFPREIFELSELDLLYAAGNKLVALPPEVGRLGALTRLYVNHNQLTTLPAEIGRLTHLTRLAVGDNPLQALPDAMRNCCVLERLYLRRTRLRRLPEWLREFPKLTHLNIEGCEFLDIPAEIAGLDTEAWGEPNARQVLDYYFSRVEQGERPLNEVKLLLVGRGESGKTCVSRALRGEDFNSGQKETAGIEIRPWQLECPGEDAIHVHLWDFAGQEITHETHRFFLTERSLYIVVLDGRTGQQMEEAEYWLSHVERYGTRRDGGDPERSPVIVALNKWESPGPYEVEQRRLKREYPNIQAFVKTDCKTGLGIDELEATIRAVLNGMPEVRRTWSTSYYEVRQLLDRKTEDGVHFMTWVDFRKLCEEGGETDRGRQHSMAENLNALGVALYYGEDERLRDTRVLNPNWAANGLYGLVRGVNQRPYEGKPGYLWAGEVAAVLAEGMKNMESVRGASIEDYPEERGGVKVHEFLLDLMVDRELGFQAATSREKPVYLLPGLLMLDEPDPADFDVADHMDRSEVRFRYLYELLPPGVMSRFIVRTHPLSEEFHRWQRGVVLGWGAATGLALCERHRNPRIDVYIRGGTALERQALAGVIRTNLDSIHRGLPSGLRGNEELDLSPPGDLYEGMAKLVRLEHEGKPVQVMTANGSLNLPVEPELERVEPATARRDDAPAMRVFVSYAHANYRAWDRLRVHLDVLANEGVVKWWYDGKIRPGAEWDDTIRRELREADIAVFLLSNDFFASSYITGVEFKEAVRRHELGELEIVPVLLEDTPSFSRQRWLKRLQAVPTVNGRLRPLNSFNPRVAAFVLVQEALRATIKEVVERRRR